MTKCWASWQRKKEKKAYEDLETYKGTDLEYKEYEPLFKCAGEAAAKQKKKGFFVLCDGYVTMSDGTGIVHIARRSVRTITVWDRNTACLSYSSWTGQGNMTAETDYAGVFVKKADP